MQVVSILEAPRILGSVSFQSNEVKGAQNSEFLFYKIQARNNNYNTVNIHYLAYTPAALHCQLLSTIVDSPLQLQPNQVVVQPAFTSRSRYQDLYPGLKHNKRSYIHMHCSDLTPLVANWQYQYGMNIIIKNDCSSSV